MERALPLLQRSAPLSKRSLACVPAPRRQGWRRLLCSSLNSWSPWPSPAWSSPASFKVRCCLRLWDDPSGSIPDPACSSPRCTPARCLTPPTPCIPAPGQPLHPSPGIAVPGASSAACLASPGRDLPVPEPPVPPFGDRCSSLALSGADSRRSWPTFGEASSLPSGESPLPRRAGPSPPLPAMGAAPGPDRCVA